MPNCFNLNSIHVLSYIDTERLTYLTFRSQARGGNKNALTNHLLRYIDKLFDAIGPIWFCM